MKKISTDQSCCLKRKCKNC